MRFSNPFSSVLDTTDPATDRPPLASSVYFRRDIDRSRKSARFSTQTFPVDPPISRKRKFSQHFPPAGPTRHRPSNQKLVSLQVGTGFFCFCALSSSILILLLSFTPLFAFTGIHSGAHIKSLQTPTIGESVFRPVP